uniref:NADH-ubiquinone oxidoreductase chain 5 n=1 Tax=Harpochytrium sp. JEL94 TaxID=109764 RepID=Q85JB7_9FUNG|nr:NADH dehydrogenase subunit 5 [Harpochytrium sp. JEL94]AAO62896.1 NADH dehydrogenase subunit 5 [Harpochytrium sp. JEL94]
MYLLILTLPLLGSLLCGFLGRKLGNFGGPLLTIIFMGITLLLVAFGYYEVVLLKSPVYLGGMVNGLGSWLSLGWINLDMGFIFDELTLSMMIPICFISFLVHIYSMGYMSDDPHLQRFFSYLSLFTFFMLIMVSSDNWLLLFLGWEGVGLVSYLLIGFWFTRIKANQSALKAFLMNRVGDTGLFLAMAMAVWFTGDLEFTTLFAILPYLNSDVVAILGFLIVAAVIAKSGQFGLHAWLPDAMEGPTPVSALIHAATMVTAGIFLLLRFSPLFGSSLFLVWLGGITALFGAIYGYVQTDMKRTIAYSTTSQLGYMVLACGIGQYGLALAHLMNHAFFKALLFLSAGVVIHAVHDEQDVRRMGGLIRLMPITYVTTLIGSLSLVALPFLTGFYSKDYILQMAFGTVGYGMGLAAAYFTTFYSLKLLHRVFFVPPQSKIVLDAHEPTAWLLFPTITLTIASIFWGYLTQYHLLSSLSGHPTNALIASHLPWWIDFVPLAAFLVAPFMIQTNYSLPTLKFNLYPYLQLANITSRYFDNGFLAWFGPHGAVYFLNSLAARLDLLSSRFIPHLLLFPLLIFILLIP